MHFSNHYFYCKGSVMAIFACLLLPARAGAQSCPNFRLNIEDLYSTHGNHFLGLSASCNRSFGKKWELGAGVEYSYASYHGDNGWDLCHLHFIPAYLNEYYYIGMSGCWAPYIHLQEGISFIRYDKEFQDWPGPRYRLREKGFYGYSGAGIGYTVSQKSRLFLEAGLKAFHLSFNNLDVNPHGFTSKLGYAYLLK